MWWIRAHLFMIPPWEPDWAGLLRFWVKLIIMKCHHMCYKGNKGLFGMRIKCRIRLSVTGLCSTEEINSHAVWGSYRVVKCWTIK